jgi:hypothetical protein
VACRFLVLTLSECLRVITVMAGVYMYVCKIVCRTGLMVLLYTTTHYCYLGHIYWEHIECKYVLIQIMCKSTKTVSKKI